MPQLVRRAFRPQGSAVAIAAVMLMTGMVPALTSTSAVAAAATMASARASAGNVGTVGGGLKWTACRPAEGPTGFQCAALRVPLDYSNPAKGTITLALDRARATGRRIGSLLINPGGPGVSGVDGLSYEQSLLSARVRSSFDLIGFDPRGVARSDPVTCLSGPQMDSYLSVDPTPTSAAGYQALVSAAGTFDKACEANSGRILPYVGTVDAARDIDQIRRAVGDRKLSYLGFSYGTLLGSTYAELFPTHIRAMVLDGAIDPALSALDQTNDQSVGFDNELTAFFAQCRANKSCIWKPGTADLAGAYKALMQRINQGGLPAGTRRRLQLGEAFYGVADALYDPSTWSDLAQGLQDAQNGDGSTLLGYSDQYFGRQPNGAFSNLQSAYTAVTCVDSQWPRSPDALRSVAATMSKRAPVFGVADLYSELPCVEWPARPTDYSHPIHAVGSPPIVVVGSTGDPATPYQEAVSLSHELAKGVLVTRVGYGHTGYRSSACVRQKVDAYLVDLAIPANGLRCPSS